MNQAAVRPNFQLSVPTRPARFGADKSADVSHDRRARALGFLVVRTAVPSLIVTLGTLFAVQGLVLGLSVALTAPG